MTPTMILMTQLLGMQGTGILLGIGISYFSPPIAVIIGVLFIILAWVSTYLSNKKLRDVFAGITEKFHKGLKKVGANSK